MRIILVKIQKAIAKYRNKQINTQKKEVISALRDQS